MILSNHYIEKKWPILEREHAVERFIEQKGESYILPVRLDGFDGEVPGLPNIRGYISAKSTEPEKVVKAFLGKLKPDKKRRDASETDRSRYPHADFLAAVNLVGSWDEGNEEDISTVSHIVGEERSKWVRKARELLQLPRLATLTRKRHLARQRPPQSGPEPSDSRLRPAPAQPQGSVCQRAYFRASRRRKFQSTGSRREISSFESLDGRAVRRSRLARQSFRQTGTL